MSAVSVLPLMRYMTCNLIIIKLESQLRVSDFDFIGCGEAGSKKEAQSIAARSFCKFLVDQGLIDPSTLPGPLDEAVS